MSTASLVLIKMVKASNLKFEIPIQETGNH